MPLGWFVPVTPGTRLVTVGGAIAADIHGKNHHVDGSFCSHVLELTLVTPTGTHRVARAEPELFWATAGGMGLTGVVTEATLRMIPVETSYLLVDTERAADLDDGHGQDAHRGRRLPLLGGLDRLPVHREPLGRSVLTRGNHARLDDLPARLRRRPDRARAFVPGTLARVPITPPSGLLNPLTVGAFNEFWFRKAPRHQVAKPHHMAGFFHPLDGVGAWNRLYGRRGFLQYQFVVPDEHGETVRQVIERLATLKLAVVSGRAQAVRPGRPGTALLPHARVDPGPRPAGRPPRARRPARRAGRRGHGGRRPGLPGQGLAGGPRPFRAMYPGVDQWLAVKDRVDPDGVCGPTSGGASACAPTNSRPLRPGAGPGPVPPNGAAPSRPRPQPRPGPAAPSRSRTRLRTPSRTDPLMIDAVGDPSQSSSSEAPPRSPRPSWPGWSGPVPDGGPGREGGPRLSEAAEAARSAGAEVVETVAFDAADVRHHQALADEVFDRFGDIDLVIVAAVSSATRPLDEQDPVAAASVITTNFTGLASAMVAWPVDFATRATGALW